MRPGLPYEQIEGERQNQAAAEEEQARLAAYREGEGGGHVGARYSPPPHLAVANPESPPAEYVGSTPRMTREARLPPHEVRGHIDLGILSALGLGGEGSGSSSGGRVESHYFPPTHLDIVNPVSPPAKHYVGSTSKPGPPQHQDIDLGILSALGLGLGGSGSSGGSGGKGGHVSPPALHRLLDIVNPVSPPAKHYYLGSGPRMTSGPQPQVGGHIDLGILSALGLGGEGSGGGGQAPTPLPEPILTGGIRTTITGKTNTGRRGGSTGWTPPRRVRTGTGNSKPPIMDTRLSHGDLGVGSTGGASTAPTTSTSTSTSEAQPMSMHPASRRGAAEEDTTNAHLGHGRGPNLSAERRFGARSITESTRAHGRGPNLSAERRAASRGRQAKGEDVQDATVNTPQPVGSSGSPSGSSKSGGLWGWLSTAGSDIQNAFTTLGNDLMGGAQKAGSDIQNAFTTLGNDLMGGAQNVQNVMGTLGHDATTAAKDVYSDAEWMVRHPDAALSKVERKVEWLGREIERHPVESAIIAGTAVALGLGAVFTGGADLAVAPEALAEAAAIGAALNVGTGELSSKLTTGKWQSLEQVGLEAAIGGALGAAGAVGGSIIEAGLGRMATSFAGGDLSALSSSSRALLGVGTRVLGGSATNVVLTLPFTRNATQLAEAAAIGAAFGFAPEAFGAVKKGFFDAVYRLTPAEDEGGILSGFRSKVGNAILHGYTPSESLPGGEVLTSVEGYGDVRGIPRDTLKATVGGSELFSEFGGQRALLTHTTTFDFGENAEWTLKGGGPRPGDTRDFYLAPPEERGGEAVSYDFYGGRTGERDIPTRWSLGKRPVIRQLLFDQEVSTLRPDVGEDYLSFRWREGTEGAGRVNVPHENWFYGHEELGGAQKWGFEWQLTAPASYRSQLFDPEGNPLVDQMGRPLTDMYVATPPSPNAEPDITVEIEGKTTPMYKVRNIFRLKGDEALYDAEGKLIETYQYEGSKLVTGEKLGWTIKQTLPEGRLGEIPILRTLFSDFTKTEFLEARIEPVDAAATTEEVEEGEANQSDAGGGEATRELDVEDYNRRLMEDQEARVATLEDRYTLIPIFGARTAEKDMGRVGRGRNDGREPREQDWDWRWWRRDGGLGWREPRGRTPEREPRGRTPSLRRNTPQYIRLFWVRPPSGKKKKITYPLLKPTFSFVLPPLWQPLPKTNLKGVENPFYRELAHPLAVNPLEAFFS